MLYNLYANAGWPPARIYQHSDMFATFLATLAAAQGVTCELCFAPPPTFAAVARSSVHLPPVSAIADRPDDRARLEATYLRPPAIRPAFWADAKNLTDEEIIHILERASSMEAKLDLKRPNPPPRDSDTESWRQRRLDKRRQMDRNRERDEKRDKLDL